MLSKFNALLFSLMLFIGVSVTKASPPSGWNGQGVITQLFIGDAGYYASSPACVVVLSEGSTNYTFAFTINTDVGRSWLSELLTARSNGATVIVKTSGTIGSPSNTAKAQVVWIQ